MVCRVKIQPDLTGRFSREMDMLGLITLKISQFCETPCVQREKPILGTDSK